jgi:SulP family sulfate permease
MAVQNLISVSLQKVPLCAAVRGAWRSGYKPRDAVQDLSSGVVVGIIAIPLSLALAIATGVPPQHGLYTAIVAGGLAALLGGSRVQITGPTAAFVVILAPIVHQYGIGGLMLATGMAGVMLIAMGLAGMGRLIEFVPYPVTAGFTAGIAVVIATLQLKDLLALETGALPEEFLHKTAAMLAALPTSHLPDLLTGAVSLFLLVILPRLMPRVPAPLVVLPVVSVAVVAVAWVAPDWSPVTINEKFSYFDGDAELPGIPQAAPPLALPWNQPGPDGTALPLSLDLIRALMGPAFAIAILAAIESLLSAVIADGLMGDKHDPDAELVGLGAANIVGTFFGGIAATGAIARTAANVRFGGRSPLAGIVHALTILAAIVLAAPLFGYLPMAALAALLLVVAWNMSEARHVINVLRIAPRSDILVLFVCFALTIIFDMAIAVGVGMVLAALLFIRRMAEVSHVQLFDATHTDAPVRLRAGVVLYEIAGPLFFGAAEKAMSALHVVGGDVQTVIFDFRRIPAMDVTGLINLRSAIAKLRRDDIEVVLAGVSGQPGEVLAKAGYAGTGDGVRVEPHFEEALAQYRTNSPRP